MRRILRDVDERELGRADESEAVRRQVKGELVLHAEHGAERGEAGDATIHQRKSAQPKAEHPHGINEKIQCHGVHRILAPGEPGLEHGEANLHEHHQEAGQSNPAQVECSACSCHRTRCSARGTL